MATLAVQRITRAGLNPAYAAASAGGDKFAPSETTFLHVKNGSASAHNVTVVTPGEVTDGLGIADLVVSVPATGERMIGPFPSRYFSNAADSGLAAVTYAAVTNVTVAAVVLA